MTNRGMGGRMDDVEGERRIVEAGAQALRHGHATNVAYRDGRVAPWRGPVRGALATEERLAEMGYPDNGFLSDDDSAYDPR